MKIDNQFDPGPYPLEDTTPSGRKLMRGIANPVCESESLSLASNLINMNKVAHFEVNELIQLAKQKIPRTLHKYLNCDIVVGYDPIRLGVHNYEIDRGHCAWPEHTTDKRCTIVMPEKDWILEHVVHEFAHVLQCGVDFDGPRCIDCTTNYSRINYNEAFAEMFTLMLFPHYYPTYTITKDNSFVSFIENLQKY